MTKAGTKPPRFARLILRLLANKGEKSAILGDLEEEFTSVAESRSQFRARLWYWSLIGVSLPSFIRSTFERSIAMIGNYLKSAWRNLNKNRGYTVINIAGLSIGLACCFLILLWVHNELSYDRFHTKRNQIYRVVCDGGHYHWKNVIGTPAPLAQAVVEGVPEIEDAARFALRSTKLIRFEDRAFYESRGVLADPSLFRIFDFPLLEGTPEAVFQDPSGLVITQTMAKKYFGDAAAVGKVLDVDGTLCTVTGIVQDPPPNSHLQFDFLAGFSFVDNLEGWSSHWGAFNFRTYLLLRKDADIPSVQEKMVDIAKRQYCPQVVNGVTFRLQPLTRVYLDPTHYGEASFQAGDSNLVTLFSATAGFILLIGCLNFMNLSTARSAVRAKEVGLRKTVGGTRSQCMVQYFSESFFLVLLSCGVALILVVLSLPVFNEIAGKSLRINFASPEQGLGLLGLLILTSLVSGSYPALALSRFQATEVLRGVIRGKQGRFFRRILVVFQFVIALILIAVSLTVFRQAAYIRNKNLGFEISNVVTIPIKGNIADKYAIVKNELLKNPLILSVAAEDYNQAVTNNRSGGFSWEGKTPDQEDDFIYCGVDFDYFETLNMNIVQGRSFSTEFPTDRGNTCILNEKAVEEMQMAEPLGKQLLPPGQREGLTIVGVVRDAYLASLHYPIEPRMFYVSDMKESTDNGQLLIKIREGSLEEAVEYIHSVWNGVNPQMPFESVMLENVYDFLYKKDRNTGHLLNIFTLLAILVSCIGLFGLTSFMAEQRTKEIGVRKVLGASTSKIVYLLSGEFTRWVIFSYLLGWPAAYFLIRKLLDNYIYRISISADLFIWSSLITLIVALATISFQSIKAALSDPVKSLRYE